MKHSRSPVTKRSQQGFSLLGLMMGTTLSIFGMLVTTSMHTRHHAAVNAIQESVAHDRLLVTAMNAVQKEIQSAGFGITDADEQHIIINSTPGTSTIPATHSILWRYIDNGVIQCRGIRESGFFTNGTEQRILNTIASDADCDVTTPLQNLAWNITDGNLGQWEVRNELATYITTNDTLFSFSLVNATCSTPGTTQMAAHLFATISAPNNAVLNGNFLPNTLTACLVNISTS